MGTDTADHRNALDTSWKVAAAVLAILAAPVTVRRLRLSEAEHQRQLSADAAKEAVDHATLVTNLSSKASEQLGSDKTAVRIGGLTDLERLAQSYPDLRQTVIDRICAYLRAPYEAPPSYSAESVEEILTSDTDPIESRLEFDVRRTAQQILFRHLHWPPSKPKPETFWQVSSLDLRDATLVEVNFAECRLPEADFRGTRFYGSSYFEDATFCGATWFDRATFHDPTTFSGATFVDHALFSEVDFNHEALFSKTKFTKGGRFTDTVFLSRSKFDHAQFREATWFSSSKFRDQADFGGAVFTAAAFINNTNFAGKADFGFAEFNNEADFSSARFGNIARFTETVFSSTVRFTRVRFGTHANFGSAMFHGAANFTDASFSIEPGLEGAITAHSGAGHVWPAGWQAKWGKDAPDDRGWLTRVH